MNDRQKVILHVVSPCEHGHEHEFREVPLGASFWTFGCTTRTGIPRFHLVTADRYPKTVTRS
jgi:hypothetical protein